MLVFLLAIFSECFETFTFLDIQRMFSLSRFVQDQGAGPPTCPRSCDPTARWAVTRALVDLPPRGVHQWCVALPQRRRSIRVPIPLTVVLEVQATKSPFFHVVNRYRSALAGKFNVGCTGCVAVTLGHMRHWT